MLQLLTDVILAVYYTGTINLLDVSVKMMSKINLGEMMMKVPSYCICKMVLNMNEYSKV